MWHHRWEPCLSSRYQTFNRLLAYIDVRVCQESFQRGRIVEPCREGDIANGRGETKMKYPVSTFELESAEDVGGGRHKVIPVATR
jgi:hypothetical protein